MSVEAKVAILESRVGLLEYLVACVIAHPRDLERGLEQWRLYATATQAQTEASPMSDARVDLFRATYQSLDRIVATMTAIAKQEAPPSPEGR